MGRLGNGVPAGWTERPAASQAADGEEQAPRCAVDIEGLERVRRARRREPARGGAALDQALVADHEAGHQAGGGGSVGGDELAFDTAGPASRAAELTSDVTSERVSAHDRPAAPGRAPTRYHPGGRTLDASAARTCRRTRLRTTAGPTARPIENATRGGVARGSNRQLHHSAPDLTRRPCRATCAIIRRSRILQIKPTGGDGPWRGGP